MRFDWFTEQDCLESGFLLVRNINDVASLACHGTRDFRIDECVSIYQIDNESIILVDPDRERRIKNHTRRIQRELRQRKSSIA